MSPQDARIPGYAPLDDGFFPYLQEQTREWEKGACGAYAAFFGADPTLADVRRTLAKPFLDIRDLSVLLSPAAGQELEALARRAAGETLRHFGRAVQLFAPLYLGNYCTNRCVYCGFHAGQKIRRHAMTPEEIEAESEALAATGLRRVLALTGDAPKRTGARYIAEAVAILARRFPSVGIEVQALTTEEYARICRAGAESMTMFQETYDRSLYAELHPAGPKRDFAFRLDAPHRAALGGMRGLTLGALLGLGDWRFDVVMMILHARWLARRFPDLDIGFSLPRLRPAAPDVEIAESVENTASAKDPSAGIGPAGTVSAGSVETAWKAAGKTDTVKAGTATAVTTSGALWQSRPVPDRQFVQILTALRSLLTHAGITISTRESAWLRDKLLPLGVTRVSAGVSTAVGGYAAQAGKAAALATMSADADLAVQARESATARDEGAVQSGGEAVQFVIDDCRSVAQMAADLRRMGFHPSFADWLLPGGGDQPLAGAIERALGQP